MFEVKVTGNSPEELLSRLRTLVESFNNPAAATLAKTGKATAANTAAGATEEDVRNAWAAKKLLGHVAADLAAALAPLGAKNIGSLKAEQYSDALAAINGIVAAAKPATLTEEDVRNAWAAAKATGKDATHLKAVLAEFVIKQDDDGEDVKAAKISELLPEQYAPAIDAFKALAK